MTEKQNKLGSDDRFVRWQGVLRDHITFLNSLLLTISIGIIGFVVTLIKDKEFRPICMQKFFLTIGLIFLCLSIVMGLVTILSRLCDFRTKLKKINREIQNTTNIDFDILKQQMEFYGNVTWASLYAQIIIFFIGILSLIFAISLIYSEKLF